MKLEIDVTPEELALVTGRCWLRSIKLALEVFEAMTPQSPDVEEKMLVAQDDFEEVSTTIESIRHKITEASRSVDPRFTGEA